MPSRHSFRCGIKVATENPRADLADLTQTRYPPTPMTLHHCFWIIQFYTLPLFQNHPVGKRREYVDGASFPPFVFPVRGLWTFQRQAGGNLFEVQESLEERWLESSASGTMGTAWGWEMWTPTLAYLCLSNRNQIVPSQFLLEGFMCLGINVKLYNLVWMSAVDEKQIPSGTERTLHPACVWGTWVELCGRDSTKFIAQVLLWPLLCNFSWSHLSYLGTWLHSALRNTSLSTVTLIPAFLFSHVKNK